MDEKILGWLISGSLGSAITFAYNYWENKKKSHFSNITNQYESFRRNASKISRVISKNDKNRMGWI